MQPPKRYRPQRRKSKAAQPLNEHAGAAGMLDFSSRTAPSVPNERCCNQTVERLETGSPEDSFADR